MAFRETTVDEIEFLANSFKDVADSLLVVAKKMRSENFLTLVLQIDSVKKHYLDPCERLAADVDMHFKDQVRCAQTGDTPKWQKSQQKAAYNKALKEAKAALDPAWVQQPKSSAPAKKTAKAAVKKSPKRKSKS